jgi:outer membrane protein OmpA-like peptidoglycan-associated protein
MRYLFTTLFITFFMVFASVFASAQPGQRYTSSNKKAVAIFEDAIRTYELGLKEESEKYVNSALSKDPKFAEAFLLRAQIQADFGRTQASIDDLMEAASIGGSKFADAIYFAGELQMRLGDYQKAEASFNQFLEARFKDELLNKRGRLMLSSCEFAQLAMANPVDFEPINLGPEINSEFSEYYPCLTADGGTFLFTRRIADGRVRGGEQEDFFVSVKEDNGWSASLPVNEINTVFNEGAPTLSADGQLLIYTACEAEPGNWGSYEGLGSCDLFVSRKMGDSWGKAQNIKAVNSYQWDSQPSFSADGKSLFFIRGIKGYGGPKEKDIWFATIQDDGSWSKPVRIPGDVNTDFEEESVMIHPDGETMYFSSNGHPGMGGLDIFVSKKRSDGTWGKPTNLGYPINTGGDENSLLVSANGVVAYFASDRPGGLGKLDLYKFELPVGVRPKPVSYVSGTVFDSYTYKPLDARLELIDLETGEIIVESYSDGLNGAFLVCLPPDRDYALNVLRAGYLFFSSNFSLKGADASESVSLEAPLNKLRPGNKMVLNNIFFDTDSYALRPASKVELGTLVKQLMINSNIRVEIGGHTDNVGSDEENRRLSEQRAQTVVSYLIEAGIETSRLVAKGYGETEPIASNDSEDGRSKNRRTEMKIIE